MSLVEKQRKEMLHETQRIAFSRKAATNAAQFIIYSTAARSVYTNVQMCNLTKVNSFSLRMDVSK